MYGHVYTEEFVNEIKALYESGMSILGIAKKYHADKNTISAHLKAVGVEIPRKLDRNDIVGNKYGMITVLSYDKEKDGYNCKCDCGNDYFMSFGMRSCYIRGRNKSCGCYSANRKHGMAHKNSLYNVWQCMKARCCNPHNKRFKNYGGRGIKICNEWKDFQSFYDWAMSNGYKSGLTIDRTNNDGNYEPSNCRWANAITQANNQSRNHKITYNGETLTLAQWTRKLNFPLHLIWKRLHRGWSEEKALTTPVRRY